MKTQVPHNFVFSQSNLHTYLNCRYKFYLRYIQKLAWPAQTTIDDLRFEEDRNAGIRFHQLLHQYFIGFNPELLIRMAENDPDSRVLVWFQTFLASPYAQLQGKLESEKTITTCVDDKNFIVKYDLLQFESGQYTIYDWKSSNKVPNRERLIDDIQTRLYPVVLSEAYQTDLPIRLIIWEIIAPDAPFVFSFSSQELKRNAQYFKSLCDEIVSLEKTDLFKTANTRQCKICEYRSHCNRGIAPATYEYLEESAFTDLEDYWNTNRDDANLV
jgi:hypothetical protein